jgi:hypothetical protein
MSELVPQNPSNNEIQLFQIPELYSNPKVTINRSVNLGQTSYELNLVLPQSSLTKEQRDLVITNKDKQQEKAQLELNADSQKKEYLAKLVELRKTNPTVCLPESLDSHEINLSTVNLQKALHKIRRWKNKDIKEALALADSIVSKSLLAGEIKTSEDQNQIAEIQRLTQIRNYEFEKISELEEELKNLNTFFNAITSNVEVIHTLEKQIIGSSASVNEDRENFLKIIQHKPLNADCFIDITYRQNTKRSELWDAKDVSAGVGESQRVILTIKKLRCPSIINLDKPNITLEELRQIAKDLESK